MRFSHGKIQVLKFYNNDIISSLEATFRLVCHVDKHTYYRQPSNR
jgi:hypothetical protein